MAATRYVWVDTNIRLALRFFTASDAFTLGYCLAIVCVADVVGDITLSEKT
jgi:hypothetical protein